MLSVGCSVLHWVYLVWLVEGSSSIAYSAPVLPGTARRFAVEPSRLTALGAATFAHEVQ